jgi:outer membrane immunogenic protein
MRKITIIFAALALSGPAFAADMAVKAPPPPVVPTWDGIYVGLNGGYSVGHDPYIQSDFVGIGPARMITTPQGGLFGAQAGYNWQHGNVVLGVEGDAQWTSQKSSTCGVTCLENYFAEFDAVSIHQKLSWFSTARARLGYADGNFLFYVTGGGAWGGVKETIQDAVETVPFVPLNFSSTLAGWVGGIGLEVLLGGPWSAKIEYLHLDLGKWTAAGVTPAACGPAVCSGPFTDVTTTAVRDDIVRFGVNYRLNGAPAAASRVSAAAPAALDSWSGFYAGLNAGYGYGSDHLTQAFAAGSALPVFTFATVTIAPQGAALGGQVGYNWQADHVVFGVEADADWTHQNDGSCTIQCSSDGSLMTAQTYRWLATGRGRIGYEHGGWLLYGTAGGALAGIRETDVFVVPDSSTYGTSRGGWTAGGGIETKLSGHWTGRIEFLHYDFGTMSNFFAPDMVTTASRLTDNVARGALNYQFHSQ